MLFVPRHEQPTANKVVDAPFIAAERNLRRVRCRWDDRVVISDIRIVHKTPTQRPGACPIGKVRLIETADCRYHLRQRSSHVRRQIATVRARIAEEFFGLI